MTDEQLQQKLRDAIQLIRVNLTTEMVDKVNLDWLRCKLVVDLLDVATELDDRGNN